MNFDQIPWPKIAQTLAKTEDFLARLDERLRTSPIREGFCQRENFADACAALWIAGELVSPEDLTLHDAGMDIRAPTHALTRAHKMLRLRRRIANAAPDWALSPSGLSALCGRETDIFEYDYDAYKNDEIMDEDNALVEASDEDKLAAAIANLDAVTNRTAQILQSTQSQQWPQQWPQPNLPRENDAMKTWLHLVAETKNLPPTLAAAIVIETWERLAPAPQTRDLGPLLGAALLRARAKTQTYLAAPHVGLKMFTREKRRQNEPFARIIVQLQAMQTGAEIGLKNHDRWLNARAALMRKLDGRRANSHLPALIDYVLATPIVCAAMIAKRLEITPRAAQNLVAELNLREITGRKRYRAWAII